MALKLSLTLPNSLMQLPEAYARVRGCITHEDWVNGRPKGSPLTTIIVDVWQNAAHRFTPAPLTPSEQRRAAEIGEEAVRAGRTVDPVETIRVSLDARLADEAAAYAHLKTLALFAGAEDV